MRAALVLSLDLIDPDDLIKVLRHINNAGTVPHLANDPWVTIDPTDIQSIDNMRTMKKGE